MMDWMMISFYTIAGIGVASMALGLLALLRR